MVLNEVWFSGCIIATTEMMFPNSTLEWDLVICYLNRKIPISGSGVKNASNVSTCMHNWLGKLYFYFRCFRILDHVVYLWTFGWETGWKLRFWIFTKQGGFTDGGHYWRYTIAHQKARTVACNQYSMGLPFLLKIRLSVNPLRNWIG